MTTWCDGALVADGAPVLRSDDHGLIVGDGVFETVKVVDGAPFALTRHLDRLAASARGLGLALDVGIVRLGIDQVLAAHRTPPLARLRITVTGGPSPLASTRGEGPPTVVVGLADATPPPPAADVAIVPWTRNEHGATAGLKTTSYADNVIALARAHRHDADEAILANTAGNLCEGTGSNVFVGLDGRLVTPPLLAGCLAGVSRALLVDWLGAVDERDIAISALAGADEAFLTSSLRDVQPIRAVDGRALPACPGPLTARAADVFAARAAADADP
jgi:branched-chain amino acid aminotransferase